MPGIMSYLIVRAVGRGGAAKRYLRSFQCGADGSIVAIAYGARDEARAFARERSAHTLLRHLGERTILGSPGHRIEPRQPIRLCRMGERRGP
jgi:hypothetical protein